MAAPTESVETSDLFANGRPRKEGFPLSGLASDGSMVTMMLWPDVDHVSCEYSRDGPASEREAGEFTIGVTWTVPHFGGQRPWLHCSSEVCARRVGRLFPVDALLLCRACGQLRYRSQAKAFPDIVRPLRRAQKLRERLRVGPVLGGPLRRPSGMHQQTYERLSAEIIDIEQAVADDIEIPTREGLESVRQLFREFLN
jgi:hypothetical protein